MEEEVKRSLRDISVELAEYKAEVRRGNLLRALGCLSEACWIGRRLAEKIVAAGKGA